MKIAILVNEDTMKRCTGKGCFNAFFNRLDSFSDYGPEAQILGFTHVGGDLEHKIKLKQFIFRVVLEDATQDIRSF